MAEQIYFEQSPETLHSKGKAPTTHFTKPTDAFNTPPSAPNTIYYLAIIKPHTDTHTLTGPVKAFRHLLPQIEQIVSNSPSAITKLDNLRAIENMWGEREPNLDFEQNGFDTFVVEGQRGVYTVLKVLREVKSDVWENLPAPVYTVVAAGPLGMPSRFEVVRMEGKGKTARPTGRAGMTRLAGSFVRRDEAREAAQRAMRDMLKGVEGVEGMKIEERWEKGVTGGGLLMAMSAEGMWEVKVVYEDQVLKRAQEGLEREGGKVGWRF